MTQTDMDPVTSSRQVRRTRQQAYWSRIRELPEAARAQALFEQWPIKLPRWLRRRLPKDTYQAWKHLGVVRDDAHWAATMEEYQAHQEHAFAQRRAQKALVAHADMLSQLMVIVDSLAGARTLTMNAALENGTEFTDVVELADGLRAADQPAICAHLALAMDASGSLVLRQQTPLHTMARDPRGQMRKIPQCRVYGV